MDIKVKQEERLGNNSRIDILGTSIDVLTTRETIALVEKYILTKTNLHLMGVNADKINSTKKNPLLKKIVNSCGVINADGASVVLASRFLGKPLPERVAGIDLMQDLVHVSSKKGYSIYLLGAKESIVKKTKEVLIEKYPNLIIKGVHNGYFKKEEWPKIAEILKEKEPDIIFVGITSPIKEYLIEFLQDNGVKGVFMGVGGSFDVISGEITRAPKWIQNSNLEWLYRVMQEPRRLFKRYFIGNFLFIRNIIGEKLKHD